MSLLLLLSKDRQGLKIMRQNALWKRLACAQSEEQTMAGMPFHYEQNEAIHHRHLALAEAPVPRLYGYYSAPSHRDVTISEFLEPLLIDEPYDDFLLDRRTFGAFLEATALFTSIQVTPQYHAHLEQGYFEQHFRSYVRDLDQLKQVKWSPSPTMALPPVAIQTLIHLLHSLCDQAETMKKGIYHWDHRPCNAGWSHLQNALVIFDLEDTLLAPRFLDIAQWLGAPDTRETRYASQEYLAEKYLGIYTNRKGVKISVDEFLSEVSVLWELFLYGRTRWYLHELGEQPADRREDDDPEIYKQGIRKRLHEVLMVLLSEGKS